MAHPAVDKFGQLIINNLRDRAIEHFDALVAQRFVADDLQTMQKQIAGLPAEQVALIRQCVVTSVDTGLHDFLFAIGESHDMEEGIAVVVDDENIAELSDGLNGEQFSDQGWIAKFGRYDESGTDKDQ